MTYYDSFGEFCEEGKKMLGKLYKRIDGECVIVVTKVAVSPNFSGRGTRMVHYYNLLTHQTDLDSFLNFGHWWTKI